MNDVCLWAMAVPRTRSKGVAYLFRLKVQPPSSLVSLGEEDEEVVSFGVAMAQ